MKSYLEGRNYDFEQAVFLANCISKENVELARYTSNGDLLINRMCKIISQKSFNKKAYDRLRKLLS